MKIIVVSDSFKGTISSKKINEIAKKEILKHYPNCEVVGLCVADGGEGTVDSFIESINVKKISTTTKGPWGEEVNSYYGFMNNTAIIEMAQTAGLPLVGNKKDPSKTTTYGVGEQILHAINNGANNIILGLGGSATNDGGCGAACALGVKFYDKNNELFCPTGETLKNIVSIDTTIVKDLLKNITIEVMCDIDNIACGNNGASYIFGRQKGANEIMMKELDEGLFHLISLFNDNNLYQLPGGAAAGGFGIGAKIFFDAKLKSGIDIVLDIVNFKQHLKGCDFVITGEGKIDGQSIRGKVPIGVAKIAKEKNVDVIAIVGTIGDNIEDVYKMGIKAVFPTNRKCLPFEKITDPIKDYTDTLSDILKILSINLK